VIKLWVQSTLDDTRLKKFRRTTEASPIHGGRILVIRVDEKVGEE
jgi:hypothetical protein